MAAAPSGSPPVSPTEPLAPPRARLTREQQRSLTLTRLLEAAEELIAVQGIAATSIEQIAEHAGYTRGAFYSNFSDKDALVLKLIERHNERGMADTAEMLEQSTGPNDFLARLLDQSQNQSDLRSTIGIEYTLYATRNAESRPGVKALTSRLLADHERIARDQFDGLDVEMPLTPHAAAKILLGLDEGFALLRLIDPDSFPVGIWADTVGFLNEAVLALAEKRQRDAG